MLATVLLAAISALFSITVRAQEVPAPANDTLRPWEVSVLNTHTPSGRPGGAPYSSLYVSISDPNEIFAGFAIRGNVTFPPISAKCEVWWNTYVEEPYGWVIPCSDVSPHSGRWSVEIQKGNSTEYGPSPTRDFKLRLVLEESMILNTGIISKTFVGEGAFALGNNLSMVCGASGVCSLSLKDGVKVYIKQTLRESKCVERNCE